VTLPWLFDRNRSREMLIENNLYRSYMYNIKNHSSTFSRTPYFHSLPAHKNWYTIVIVPVWTIGDSLSHQDAPGCVAATVPYRDYRSHCLVPQAKALLSRELLEHLCVFDRVRVSVKNTRRPGFSRPFLQQVRSRVPLLAMWDISTNGWVRTLQKRWREMEDRVLLPLLQLHSTK
jgi:hypothetical protein